MSTSLAGSSTRVFVSWIADKSVKLQDICSIVKRLKNLNLEFSFEAKNVQGSTSVIVSVEFLTDRNNFAIGNPKIKEKNAWKAFQNTRKTTRLYNDGRISWSGLTLFISNNTPRSLLLVGLGGIHFKLLAVHLNSICSETKQDMRENSQRNHVVDV